VPILSGLLRLGVYDVLIAASLALILS